jgi:hypothetical protein
MLINNNLKNIWRQNRQSDHEQSEHEHECRDDGPARMYWLISFININ